MNNLVGRKNWNFDLEDCDNILKVHSYPEMNNFLIVEINKMGFECIELY
ncbi:hypothetical protein [Abyssalbus ytuae]|uniref:Uncharacterized protein n=1 Tax=Abyssalbus ytuae TaxID=2926907 RepID=A0A9E6ZT11_9FLAO|nr:hypothetical protein [Abyssalbus ytuae]UOB16156.1 hypothetical protein MQE35_10445 [Abyssalbus ytuae]